MTPVLASDKLPAKSAVFTVSTPPAATAACRSAAVVLPRSNVTDVSLDEIDASVAIDTPSRYNVAVPPVASPATTVALAVRLVLVAVNLFERTTPPTGVSTSDVGATGATVSTPIAALAASDPVAPGDISVKFAALPAASLIDPPFNTSDAVVTKSRSVVTSPATVVYLNVAIAPEALR